MKLKQWMQEWLENYVKPFTKRRTYQKYLYQIEIHINPQLGEYNLEELSATVLQKFVTELTKEYASNTVNGIISILKSALKRAVLLGYITKEFTDSIVRPKAKEKRVDCFSIAEQRRIEQHISNSKNMKLFGIVFCLYSGLRIGELLALKWEDIDLPKGVITVSKSCRDIWQNGRYKKILESPKTDNSNRVIPIPKQLLPKLKELKKNKSYDYFVGGRSEQGSQIRSYQKTFERLLKNLKIPHKGFHALRHTFATRALECGMDIKTLSEILGHKNATITLNRYAHSLLEHKTEMMNKIGRLLS